MEPVCHPWFMLSPLANTSCTSGTGEHGVGVGKKEFLTDELGEGTVELMRTVKRAVDPLNLMNPGKVCWKRVPVCMIY